MSRRTRLAPADATADGVVVDLDEWKARMSKRGHTTDYKRAKALGMDHAVLSRLRRRQERQEPTFVGPRFIARTLALGIPYGAVFRNAAAAPATSDTSKEQS